MTNLRNTKAAIARQAGIFLLAGFGLWAGMRLAQPRRASAASNPPVGVAVVELFTSQGCSSCPPAEELLGQLHRAASASGQRVYTLAFHVDYWNDLGWRDPFSSADYSARQQRYSQAFGLDQVYTPQMIVNGRKQFVGSSADEAQTAIKQALSTTADDVQADISPADGGGFTLHYRSSAPAGSMINVAVVEEGLMTQVGAGENSGRHLDQPSVVRWFTTARADAAGQLSIPALPNVHADHASVIVFVQEPYNAGGNGAAVLGATSMPLK
jgi:hypothetical protein